MKQCPNGHTVDDNAKFCPQCGAEIVGANCCAKCGEELVGTEKFCPKCGNPTSKNFKIQSSDNNEQNQAHSLKFGWLEKIIGIIALIGFIGFLSKKCESKESALTGESTTQMATEQVEEKNISAEEDTKEDKILDFLGTYEITDKVGCTIHLTLNEDETATITGVRGESVTYYCTWDDFRNRKFGIRISFSDNVPYLVYDGGVGPDDGCGICLKDGWLYQNYHKAEANNPEWRLKATKIK